MKALGLGNRFYSTMAFVLLFCACTPCDHYYEPHDTMAKALLANPECTFVDSSGQTLEMFFVNAGFDDFETSSAEGRCQSIETQHFPNFHFQFMPANEGKLVYSQLYDYLQIKDIFVSYHIGDYNSPSFIVHNKDTTLTIQGHDYVNCWSSIRWDSLGFHQFVAVDMTYGLVVFQYRDEYRWERVLNP